MCIPVPMHNTISSLVTAFIYSRDRETFLCSEVKSAGHAFDGKEVAGILGSLEIKGMYHSVVDIFKVFVTPGHPHSLRLLIDLHPLRLCRVATCDQYICFVAFSLIPSLCV